MDAGNTEDSSDDMEAHPANTEGFRVIRKFVLGKPEICPDNTEENSGIFAVNPVVWEVDSMFFIHKKGAHHHDAAP
jgi:hypothetical protein